MKKNYHPTQFICAPSAASAALVHWWGWSRLVSSAALAAFKAKLIGGLVALMFLFGSLISSPCSIALQSGLQSVYENFSCCRYGFLSQWNRPMHPTADQTSIALLRNGMLG